MKRLIYLLGLAILSFACHHELVEEVQDDSCNCDNEIAEGKEVEILLNGKPATVVEHNGHYIWQGDIILNTDNAVKTRDANGRIMLSLRDETRHWTNNTIYYELDPDITDKDRVTAAIAEFRIKAKFIKFKPKPRDKDVNHVYIANGGSGICVSSLGMIGGRQYMYLSPNCSPGSIIHEFCHALGVSHEHSRFDRDKYITVHEQNIRLDYLDQFEKLDTIHYIQPGKLDFNSIMLYSPYSFSRNGKPTITKKDGSTYQMQRLQLSDMDVIKLAAMYNVPYARLEYTEVKKSYLPLGSKRHQANVYVAFYYDAEGKIPCYELPAETRYFQNTALGAHSESIEHVLHNTKTGSHRVKIADDFVFELCDNCEEPGGELPYAASLSLLDSEEYHVIAEQN